MLRGFGITNGLEKHIMDNLIMSLTKLLLVIVLTSCGTTMANKFDWKATESAPKKYPMKIVKGDFYAPDGYSLYVPNMKLIHHGWGNSISSHLVGPDLKSLPNKLIITFFSYSEDQFYHGEFDLPYEEILRLFKEGYFSPKEDGHITYFEINAGVAPGGTVSVWLGGIDKTTEVFSGQADKTDVDWKVIIDNSDITRAEFIKESIDYSRTPEEQELLKGKDVPIGLWQTYLKRYNWQPLFSGQEPPKIMELIKYYNGEEGYLFYPLEEKVRDELRAIPKELHFNWEWPKGRLLSFELYFDEEEIFAAFKKLSKANLPLYLEMLMEKTEKGTEFWVLLKNDNESIVLRKPRLENYGVRKKP